MDNKSISHTKWKCQYHIAFILKYRKCQYHIDISNDSIQREIASLVL
ncbi:hypothetical protein GCM10008922_46060 [Faecalicatena contorta]